MARSRRRIATIVPATEQARGSIVSVTVGSRHLPAVLDNTCPVCTHPARPVIEERLLYNEPYPAISAWVSGRKAETVDGLSITWPPLSAWQIAGHYANDHCPVDTRVLHQLTQQRLSGTEADYDHATERIVDHVVTLAQVAQLGQERLARGEVQPTIKETISAAKAVAAIDLASRAVEQVDHSAQYEQAMEVYFSAAKQVMTGEQWRHFGALLATDPVLRRLSGQDGEPDAVDAVIVQEEM
jgi:hypothetical protein